MNCKQFWTLCVLAIGMQIANTQSMPIVGGIPSRGGYRAYQGTFQSPHAPQIHMMAFQTPAGYFGHHTQGIAVNYGGNHGRGPHQEDVPLRMDYAAVFGVPGRNVGHHGQGNDLNHGQNQVGSHGGNHGENQVGSHGGNHGENQVGNQVGNLGGGHIRSQVGNQFGNQAENQVRNQAGDHVGNHGNQAENHVDNQFGNHAQTHDGNQAGHQAENQFGNHGSDQLRNHNTNPLNERTSHMEENPIGGMRGAAALAGESQGASFAIARAQNGGRDPGDAGAGDDHGAFSAVFNNGGQGSSTSFALSGGLREFLHGPGANLFGTAFG